MDADYIPVDIQFLQPEVEKPFRLYLLLGDNYVPYSEGDCFTEETRQRLLREGIRNLHIRVEEKRELRD